MKTKDKRKAPRSRHDSVLEIYDDSGQLLSAVGKLVNVSRVGFCFSSTTPFSAGQKIKARIRLLKEGAMDTTGQVVWSRKKTNYVLYGVKLLSAAAVPKP